VRRLIAILQLLVFLAVASGAAGALHQQQHHHTGARSSVVGVSSHITSGDSDPDGDEGHCQLCFDLHAAAIAVSWIPLLVCLGLLITFLTELPSRLPSPRIPDRLDCRGPPALA
jgi:hypothetical protein